MLSSGGTGSRTTAIRDYIDGDYVRGAYADEEMDEKIGVYKMLYARQVTGSTRTLSAGDTKLSTDTTTRLYPVHVSRTNDAVIRMTWDRSSGVWEIGDWVLVGGRTTTTSSNPTTSVPFGSVGLWMRYA